MMRWLLPLLVLLPAAAADLTPLDEAGFAKMVASHKGKVLLVNFWATYCVPCRKEMPALVTRQKQLGAKGFQLITVSADEPEQEKQAREFLTKTGVPAPSYILRTKDNDKFINATDKKWGGALPYSMLYDRTGKKAKVWYGEIPLKELDALLPK